MKLQKYVKELAHDYVRKGGKDNRRQQLSRMLAFAAYCESLGTFQMGQVGAKHVISYWKSNRALTGPTRYNHWLAIRELWRLSGKAGDPPRPHEPEHHATGGSMEKGSSSRTCPQQLSHG